MIKKKLINLPVVLNICLSSVQIVILFMPMVYLNYIFFMKFDFTIIPIFIVPIICSGLSCFAVVSKSIIQAVVKCLLSIPITILLYPFFIEINFLTRALNWISPAYGEQGADGSFASEFIYLS